MTQLCYMLRLSGQRACEEARHHGPCPIAQFPHARHVSESVAGQALRLSRCGRAGNVKTSTLFDVWIAARPRTAGACCTAHVGRPFQAAGIDETHCQRHVGVAAGCITRRHLHCPALPNCGARTPNRRPYGFLSDGRKIPSGWRSRARNARKIRRRRPIEVLERDPRAGAPAQGREVPRALGRSSPDAALPAAGLRARHVKPARL